MTPEQRRARAYAARALMDDATLNDAWNDIEAEIVAEWGKDAPWHDERAKDVRDRLWIELQAMRKFRQRLASFAGAARD